MTVVQLASRVEGAARRIVRRQFPEFEKDKMQRQGRISTIRHRVKYKKLMR